MINWVVEPFELAIQQRALVGGSLAAVVLALVGTWVVIRGMSFLGDALVHGIIPGIALAVLFDFNPMLGALLAAAVMLFGIGLVHRQTTFSEDTSIGLLFVGMLSLGVILVSRTASFAGNLTSILFGDALGVTRNDLVVLGVLLAIVVVASVVLYRPFLVLSFNEQKAQLLGQRPRLAHAALLTLIAIAIIGSFQTVGTLLVFGMLVGPPSAASLIVRRVPLIIAGAAILGVFSVAAGLLVSYHADTSASATIAIVPIVIFFLILGVRTIRQRLASPSAHATV